MLEYHWLGVVVVVTPWGTRHLTAVYIFALFRLDGRHFHT